MKESGLNANRRPRQKVMINAGRWSRDMTSRQELASRQDWEAKGTWEAMPSQTSLGNGLRREAREDRYRLQWV